MKPYIQPAPADQPKPDERPAPAKPPRRSFTQPTFGGGNTGTGVKTFATLTLIMGLVGAAHAQTHPVPDPPSPPGVPTQPMDPDRREPRTEPQQPVTPQDRSNEGWTMFDDRSSLDLKLQRGQLDRLREVDNRYRTDYMGLGQAPSANPGYRSLTDRRNADVKGILTPAQYEQWMQAPRKDDRMDHEPDGTMKKDGTSTPTRTGQGTVTPMVAPATKPAPMPTTTPKD